MFIVKFNELFLHGVRRGKLVRALLKRIGEAYPEAELENLSGRILVHSEEGEKLERIFGIYKYSRAIEASELSIKEFLPFLKKEKKYKIEVKKTSSTLKQDSISIAQKLAEELYDEGYAPSVKDAEDEIRVEVRNDRYFFYLKSWEKRGPGGFPYGSYGRALVLFSGGFDSPVASWLAARKGLALDFLVVPFNSEMEEAVKEQWLEFCKAWNIRGKLYSIRSCPISTGILNRVRKGIKQIVLKKAFYYLGTKIARGRAVITGESINQTSTQRVALLKKIEHNIEGFFIRPLATYTKEEIIELSRRIGTYERSEKQKEYCSIEKVVREEATQEEIDTAFEDIKPLLDVLEAEEIAKA